MYFIVQLFLMLFRRSPAMPQQELAQTMTRPVLILLRVFSGAHQVAQCLVRGIRNPNRRQIAAAIAARQFLGIATIRLHPVARFDRDQRRRYHFAGNTQRGQLPIHDVARRTRFVARPQILALGPVSPTSLRIDSKRLGITAERRELRRFRFGYRYRDGVRVDIQTNKSYLRHATNSFRMRLCAAGFTSSQRNPRHCESAVGRSILTSNRHIVQSKTVKYFAVLAVIGCSVGLAVDNHELNSQKRPIDYVNALVGTAPLDNPTLIGNAPPPGEELYTGMTSPGAVLPHGVTNLGPINKNLDLSYPAGVGMSYNYTHPVMLGFSSAMQGLVVMPVVGHWTVPPERSAAYYDKAKEKAVPGYYTVYLNDFGTKVELTATAHTGMYRFTFPQSPEAHVVMDLGRAGGNIQVVGDHTIRGQAQRGFRGQIAGTSQRSVAQVYFVAEFSKPFRGIWHVSPEPARSTGPGISAGIGFGHCGFAVRIRKLCRCLSGLPGHRTRAGPDQNRFGREF